MPIAGYGGLVTDAQGGRSWPGSAGFVGSYEPPFVGGYSNISGAGSAYNRVIPANTVNLPENAPCIDCNGGGVILPDDPPIVTGGGGTGGGSGGGTGGGSGGGTGGGSVECPSGDCNSRTEDAAIWSTIRNLLQPVPRTQIEAKPPMYLVTPSSPQIINGISPAYVVVAIILIGVGYFAYKRLGK